jgi:hypothetical protein
MTHECRLPFLAFKDAPFSLAAYMQAIAMRLPVPIYSLHVWIEAVTRAKPEFSNALPTAADRKMWISLYLLPFILSGSSRSQTEPSYTAKS